MGAGQKQDCDWLPRSLRDRAYRLLKPSGIAYTLSYLAKYRRSHSTVNFAGHLHDLKQAYATASPEEQQRLSAWLLDIVDCLVLKNGVTKTTYPQRHDNTLLRTLESGHLQFARQAIRILDVPSSIGASALNTYAILNQHFAIESYILGDLMFEVLYDRSRECVFDDSGALLQVKGRRGFWSLYRPHTSGDVYGSAAKILFAPIDALSERLRRAYPFREPVTRLLLVHPEIERRLQRGCFHLEKIDVFRPIPGEYDLILSFNLLQKNYFTNEEIRIGVANLTASLARGGVLIMGNTEAYSVSRKVGTELITLERSGEF